MKIETSTVKLTASHEASYERRLEVASQSGFRQLFESMAASDDENLAELRKRVQRLLDALVGAIFAAMDGRQCRQDDAAWVPLPATAEEARTGREFAWQSTISERVEESERTQVCASGTVNTCDGRELAFDLSLEMSRHYGKTSVLSESGSVRLRDPLVLNFSGQSCELSEQRFSFDLDCDGKVEYLPELGAGNCFLVFDRNGNGRADDGSELFGASSGDGFAELASHDLDGNGWIDEGDAAFDKLALWSGERFESLTAAGVGALHTGAVAAPFSLKSPDNVLLGQIRAAGVYLMESGRAGIMQQVDLATSAAPAEPEEAAQRHGLQA
ncbi:hypothetical protein [Azonexus sp.]|uniref:hypothetical protein n=1 Tax=Azonexus sp. TaxID=1872668 RepID=UPI0035B2335F